MVVDQFTRTSQVRVSLAVQDPDQSDYPGPFSLKRQFMPNDPILDAIVGRASSGVAVADDDPILTAIQGRSSAPAATEEDPILTSLRTRQSTQKPIASAEMIGKYARDNNATIRQAHEYFRSQGFSIPGDEGTAEQQTPSAPRIITLPPRQTRTVKPTKLLDQPPFEAPSMTEIVGNALPDWSAPVLAAGEKYAVQPFERMAAAGAEAGGQIARLPLKLLRKGGWRNVENLALLRIKVTDRLSVVWRCCSSSTTTPKALIGCMISAKPINSCLARLTVGRGKVNSAD